MGIQLIEIGTKIGTYKSWNLYRISWTDDGSKMKIAATRYEFGDCRSPIVHKNYIIPQAPPDDFGVVQIAEGEALESVKTEIDKIEIEGLDVCVARLKKEMGIPSE